MLVFLADVRPGLLQTMQRHTGQSAKDGIALVQIFQVNEVVGHPDKVADDACALFGLLHAEHFVGDPESQLGRTTTKILLKRDKQQVENLRAYNVEAVRKVDHIG